MRMLFHALSFAFVTYPFESWFDLFEEGFGSFFVDFIHRVVSFAVVTGVRVALSEY